jgi:hypothetical protein
MNEDVQPNGQELTLTADVVEAVLIDPEVCSEVRERNGWSSYLTAEQVALKFLAQRFQEAVGILSMRTHTLKRDVDGNTSRVISLEDKVFGIEPTTDEE